MTIRLAVAEDQRMVRELLVTLLVREADIEVVGEAASGPQAIEISANLRPDVLVLDIGLPEIDGMEVTRTLKSMQPGLRILALSIHAEKQFVNEMLKAGADGYMVKSAALTELVPAIRIVAQGKLYLSPEVARDALGDLLAPRSAAEASGLGLREKQVLALLSGGKRSSEIAAQLHISVATVEAHRRNIMRKLGLHTVAELTKYALRHGLTSL